MLLRTKLHGRTYEFPDIRILMGQANEEDVYKRQLYNYTIAVGIDQSHLKEVAILPSCARKVEHKIGHIPRNLPI